MNMNGHLKKVNHPVVSWSLLVAVITLAFTGIKAANSLENLAESNKAEIKLERELRVSEQQGLKEDLRDLKLDTKEIADNLKAETTQIKNLLQQLLLRQAGIARNPRNQ